MKPKRNDHDHSNLKNETNVFYRLWLGIQKSLSLQRDEESVPLDLQSILLDFSWPNK
jgi:hypothetical protein